MFNLFNNKKMIQLSQKAAGLIKYILTFSGEKEVNQGGQEVDSLRTLCYEESSQRRHFMKSVNPLLEEKQTRISIIAKEAEEKIKVGKDSWKTTNVKEEKESDKDYEARMNVAIGKNESLTEIINSANKQIASINEETLEFELTPKTISVIKKYIDEFGNKRGWKNGDDEVVEEIITVLK